eukprot:scaffold23969_cov26-Tisochrysis_lutea.AAC.2
MATEPASGAPPGGARPALDTGHGAQPADDKVTFGAEVVDATVREVAVSVLDSSDASVLRDGRGARRIVALHLGHRLDG